MQNNVKAWGLSQCTAIIISYKNSKLDAFITGLDFIRRYALESGRQRHCPRRLPSLPPTIYLTLSYGVEYRPKILMCCNAARESVCEKSNIAVFKYLISINTNQVYKLCLWFLLYKPEKKEIKYLFEKPWAKNTK